MYLERAEAPGGYLGQTTWRRWRLSNTVLIRFKYRIAGMLALCQDRSVLRAS